MHVAKQDTTVDNRETNYKHVTEIYIHPMHYVTGAKAEKAQQDKIDGTRKVET